MPSTLRNRLYPRGVTFMELLVVVGLMSAILVLAVPNMTRLLNSGHTEAGVNSVTTGVTAARAYATRQVQDLKDVHSDYQTPDVVYAGTAILFTPAHEIRLLENDQVAADGSNDLLQQPTSGLPRYGFTDLPDREYINMPAHTGVLGIARGGGANELKLLAPPFAIRFSDDGTMVATMDAAHRDKLVYYDADYDGTYTTGSSRGAGYDPDDWDPSRSNVAVDGESGRYELPFHEIETVVGVLIFNRSQMPDNTSIDSVYTVNDGANPSGAQLEWLLATNADGKLKNSVALFFSRYTGIPLREVITERGF
ncbi:MAG: hypothetical protein R3336_08190 [Phycisphaeraceae bacterium]|nr:hypothetical protein [Phycisphaeraceae bacterium]